MRSGLERPEPPVELLAPAGSLEKLEIVLHYGADAVYLAGKAFSLRNFSDNFDLDQLQKAIGLAHDHQAKVYVAVNIFARNEDIAPLADYLRAIALMDPDGVIVADPAVLALSKRLAPGLAIHLSTQANTTNVDAVRFWQSQGVRRINLARELSLAEIRDIVQASGAEIETFVHGAMCISYSGRCLLSNYMAQRPSNQGMCCQPCRFNYAVVEQTRPGQYFPLAEDERGTYLFNSKDLCLLDHLPDLIRAGVRSLKIEGRMKSIHYAATTVKIYREAIDCYYRDPDRYQPEPYWQSELDKVTSRGYCTGFVSSDPDQLLPRYEAQQASAFQLVGKVLSPTAAGKTLIEARNRIQTGDAIEIMGPQGPPLSGMIHSLTDRQGHSVSVTHPGSQVVADLGHNCRPMDLLRHRVQA